MRYPNYTGSEPCTQVGAEWFFPADVGNGSGVWSTYVQAKQVCADCWVRVECAEWAIHHEGDGMWGGLTPMERRAIRGRRGVELVRPENLQRYGPGYESA